MPEPGYNSSSSTSSSSRSSSSYGGGYYGGDSDNDSSSRSASSSSRSVDTSSLAGILEASSSPRSPEPSVEERIRSTPSRADVLSSDTAIDTIVNSASNLGAANVGYNIPMQGANLGPVKVDAMKFGAFAPGTTSPTAGTSINTFGRPAITDAGKFDFGGYMARQTMVSSQAAFEYAQTVDPGLSNTRFEVASPDSTVNRAYDIEFTNPNGSVDLVEVKAGKSINYGQAAKDVNLANATGQAIDYVHTGNPLTGNHGPDQTTLNKLNNMGNQTNGLITHQTADIAPTTRQIDAVVGASRFSRLARGSSKVLGPAAVALDVYTIKTAVDKDGGTFGDNTKVAVAETAGGWAGAAAGGWAGAQLGGTLGAFGGPVGAAVGATAGGIIGAVGGAIGGSSLGKAISGWW